MQIVSGSTDLASLAESLYPKVIRHDFSQPGFGYVRFEDDISSQALRRLMIQLKEHLSVLSTKAGGVTLHYLSMGRFNQRETTRFHLDGAPAESYLMLGYEPSRVKSELYLADYTRLAVDLGINSKEFLDGYNPMFADHEQRLTSYVQPVEGFDSSHSGILLINNSSLPFNPEHQSSQGVMHKAIIHPHEPSWIRVVNSTMLGAGGEDHQSKEEQRFFAEEMPVA